MGGWVCQTSLAYELCNRNLVYELRLPLSLPKNLSKQVSENNIESINQKHKLYSLCEVLAFKVFCSFCSKFQHFQAKKVSALRPKKKYQHFTLYRHKQDSALKLQQEISFSTIVQTVSFSIHPSKKIQH